MSVRTSAIQVTSLLRNMSVHNIRVKHECKENFPAGD